MPSSIHSLIEDWAPPRLRELGNRLLRASLTFRGPYPRWDSAVASTQGYDDRAVLDRVVRSTHEVLAGRARYEQDGFLFHESPPPSTARAGILLAAALESGDLSVLDFGGALASHYLRWRPMLDVLPNVRWTIVEQEGFVNEGRRIFASNKRVSFERDIGQVSQVNVVLASGVLHCIPDPHAVMARLAALNPKVIVIDRTAYAKGGEEGVFTQHLPARFGGSSYPVWFLSRDRIHRHLVAQYDLIEEFRTPDSQATAGCHSAEFWGSVWIRRT